MTHYTPQGRAHRMLARLEEGPARARDLHEVADRRKRRQMFHVVNAIRAHGLADRDDACAAFVLSARGAQALAILRQGLGVDVTANGSLAASGREVEDRRPRPSEDLAEAA